MNLVSSSTGKNFLKKKKTIRAIWSGGCSYAVWNKFSSQRLEELIGEDFTLEGADMSGELSGHRLFGTNFQDVFAGLARSDCVEGLTQESGGSGWMEKKTGGLQGFGSVKRKL